MPEAVLAISGAGKKLKALVTAGLVIVYLQPVLDT